MTAKISFSTLACPSWNASRIVKSAAQWGYDGIEFRTVEGETELWKLAGFQGAGLGETKRLLSDAGLALPCLDTSACFHSHDARIRKENLEGALRMAELAAQLGAPAIRVFGDRIQPGQTRGETAAWIAESLLTLEEKLAPAGVAVWLETHGDFARAEDVRDILIRTGGRIGTIWDPANILAEYGESPRVTGEALGALIRHVHLKDFVKKAEGWEYALTGEGGMPFDEVRGALDPGYSGFFSFEWEKHWHPSLAEPGIALPHFATWFRQNWHS